MRPEVLLQDGAFSTVRRPAGVLAQQVALGLDDWRALIGAGGRHPPAASLPLAAPCGTCLTTLLVAQVTAQSPKKTCVFMAMLQRFFLRGYLRWRFRMGFNVHVFRDRCSLFHGRKCSCDRMRLVSLRLLLAAVRYGCCPVPFRSPAVLVVACPVRFSALHHHPVPRAYPCTR